MLLLPAESKSILSAFHIKGSAALSERWVLWRHDCRKLCDVAGCCIGNVFSRLEKRMVELSKALQSSFYFLSVNIFHVWKHNTFLLQLLMVALTMIGGARMSMLARRAVHHFDWGDTKRGALGCAAHTSLSFTTLVALGCTP